MKLPAVLSCLAVVLMAAAVRGAETAEEIVRRSVSRDVSYLDEVRN